MFLLEKIKDVSLGKYSKNISFQDDVILQTFIPMEAINKVDLFSRELWVVSTAHAKDEAISQVPNSQAPNGHGDATQKSRPSPKESITNLSLEVSSLGKVSR